MRAMPKFLRHPAAPGLLLAITAAAAMIVANTAAGPSVSAFWESKFGFELGPLLLKKSLSHWVNDGLMAVFFLVVGLEIKREFLFGALRDGRHRVLPLAAAIGGMAVPALIFLAANWASPETRVGWAIPAATDIAFALGALALLGSRAPLSLKTLLLAIAVLDDLGAIVVIALFYTSSVSMIALGIAAAALAALIGLNRSGVVKLTPYLVIGFILWIAILKSGVHATLAGVLLAFTIPSQRPVALADSPLEHLEHALVPYVNFLILPIFAFANAGVPLAGLSPGSLMEPLAFGIWAGLLFGKQIGVLGGIWVGAKVFSAKLPAETTWRHIYGLALLTGIGFTMSLFIGGLAVPEMLDQVRIGVLFGSILAGIAGCLVIATAPPADDEPEAAAA